MTTLTSANSVLALGITDLFDTPQIISGFGADDMFSSSPVENAELVFGADGTLSAGYVFNVKETELTIMPNSPAMEFFMQWVNAENVAREKYTAFGLWTIPSINKKFTLATGYLMRIPPLIGAGRILQPFQVSIAWQTITGESTS